MGGIEPSRLMKPFEVARAFDVDTKTVTRWAIEGKLKTIRTLGGHRRYDRAQVNHLIFESGTL